MEQSWRFASNKAAYSVLGLALVMAVMTTSGIHQNGPADNLYQPAYAAIPYGEPDLHPPPLQQEDVLPSDVRCNEPRELYLHDASPLCLFPDAIADLEFRGFDLIKGQVQQPPSDLLGLTDEEKMWLVENPLIHVGYDPGWFPIEYTDEHGRIAGYTLNYIIKFEELIGVDLQPFPSESWSHTLEAARERDIDIIFMIAKTAERTEYLGFTNPHYILESALVTTDDRMLRIDDPDLVLITIRDYSIEAWLDENHPDTKYISVDSFAEGLAMLRDGEADAFADVWPVVHALAELEGMTVYNAGSAGFSFDLSIGYSSDQPILGSILEKSVAVILADDSGDY